MPVCLFTDLNVSMFVGMPMYVCTHVHANVVRAYTPMRVLVCVCTCTYVCMYVFTYVGVPACMYVRSRSC